MNPSKQLIDEISSTLNNGNLSIIWTLPDEENSLYSYSIPELGIIATSDSINGIIGIVISTIIDSNEYFKDIRNDAEGKTSRIDLLKKLNELYISNESEFMKILLLNGNDALRYAKSFSEVKITSKTYPVQIFHATDQD